MGILRIYKKFFCINTRTNPHEYTLISPTSLNASTYVAGANGEESSTLIESNIQLVEEELGIFYANMNPELYAEDVTYDLVFYVQYTPEAPLNKRLPVRFRIKAKSIVTQLEFELGDISRVVEVEYGDAIGIELDNNNIDIDLSYEQVELYVNNNNQGPNEIEIN